MNGYFESSDPLFFADQQEVLFRRTGIRLEGNTATGKLFGIVSRSQYTQLKSDTQLIVDQNEVTAATARTYAGIFDRQASRQQIPWILGPLGLIPVIGAGITIATSTLDGMMRLARSTVTPGQLAVLMAAGGTFQRAWSIERSPRHGELLVNMVLYTVSVGREVRVFGILSSKYALKVQ